MIKEPEYNLEEVKISYLAYISKRTLEVEKKIKELQEELILLKKDQEKWENMKP